MSPSLRQTAGKIIDKMRATYGKPLTRVPASEADFRHLDLGMYDRMNRRFGAAGFTHVWDYAVVEINTSPTSLIAPTFIRTWTTGEEGLLGSYYQKRTRWGRLGENLATGLKNGRLIAAPAFAVRAAIPRHCVEFRTEFEDGTSLTTSNAEAAEFIGMPAQLQRKFHPYGTPLQTLLADHRARVAALGNRHGAPVPIRDAGELGAAMARENEIKRLHRAAIGWVTHGELVKMSRGKTEMADAIYAEVRTLLREGY